MLVVYGASATSPNEDAQDALANDKRVLEKIPSGASLGTVLNVLVRGVEAQRYHQLAVQQQIARNYYMAAEMDRAAAFGWYGAWGPRALWR